MKRNYLPLAVLALVLCAVFIGVGEAITANEDFVSTLVREFYNKTSDWESTLKRYALIVFRWLVTLEVCFLGSKAALNRDQIPDIFKQFVMLLLMAGFFLAVINYYQEWAWSLINGLGAIGRELTPGGYSSESPFLTGMQLVKLVQDKLSVWSPGNSIALLIAALVIIVCFALISAQVVFIKCEAMVAMAAALILVAFGGSSFLKDYAVNAIRYVLAVAFKLFVMQLVLGIGIAFIEGFSTSTAELQDIFVVIGASVVLAGLGQIPAGRMRGHHQRFARFQRRGAHRFRRRCWRRCPRRGCRREQHHPECEGRFQGGGHGRRYRPGQSGQHGEVPVWSQTGRQNLGGKVSQHPDAL